MDPLVSTEWLARELGASDLRILDATYHPLDPARDPRGDYEAGHIPGALFLDLATSADAGSKLPSMLPEVSMFSERMRALGIDAAVRVVLYDDAPHHTAARAWWVLTTLGLTNVALLDGGFAKWKSEGRPLANGAENPVSATSDVSPVLNDRRVRDLAQMRAIAGEHSAQIVDARSFDRFSGAEPDPRPGIAPGHIPGSRNLPYEELFHEDGTWKTGYALRAAFEDAGVEPDRPMVMTCGSGITAAVLAFGAHLLGERNWALYDGSWSEWGADPDTPKALHAA